MSRAMTLRNVVLALLGATVLILKGHYSGPGEQFIGAYAGNLGVSFALYFAMVSGTQQLARPRLSAALITLAAVTLFEITDGFGIMVNVYDPWDLVANVAGVCLALVVDLLTTRFMSRADRTNSALT